MAATAPIPLALYLSTSYSPDREYIDGEIQERNFGEYDHAAVQTALARWFGAYRVAWHIRAVVECRVQVSPTRFRVPDVTVLDRAAPVEQIITRPPLICIEVLSPGDRLPRTLEKVADYRRFGVPAIWIINPESRDGFDCTPDALIRTTHFTFPGRPFHLDLPALFADLD